MASNEETVLGKLCDPCFAQEKQVLAIVICKDCESECLCVGCSGLHKVQKATKAHILLPIDDLEMEIANVNICQVAQYKQNESDPSVSLYSRVTNIYLGDPKQQNPDHNKTTSTGETDGRNNAETPQSKAPGQPKVVESGCDFIVLHWEKPSFFEEGFYFQIGYKECTSSNSKWKPYTEEFNDNCARLSNLKANTEFVFRVRVMYGDDEGPYSAVSDKITTSTSLASRLAKQCKVIDSSKSPVKLELPLKEDISARNEPSKTRMFEVGDARKQKDEKIIMLIGETGTGKSTLVDGMINYILGVNWEDPFRFSMITLEPEEQKKSSNQAESQTEWISCYKIHPENGGSIPYTLTIIDTPGFGDTRGIKRDREIVDQIRALFSNKPPSGVLTIDAICFLIKAPDARLTAMQKYIFQSIMALFGKDIEENICSLITFADGKEPPVLAALRQSDLPFGKHFTFNNSGLFVDNTNVDSTCLSPIFWGMGKLSFQTFFEHLGTLPCKSLQLTSDVLFERYRLESTLKCIQPTLKNGILKLHERQEEKRLLEQFSSEMDANANFTTKVMVPKPVQIPVPNGLHVTNCINCTLTCHENCGIPDDGGKKSCWAMDSNGYCRICEKKCFWDRHFNMRYIFKTTEEEETRTLTQIEDRYKDASGKKLSKEKIVMKINNELKDLAEIIEDMMTLIHECNQRLNMIALRPNPINMVDLIDLMIENERNSNKDGMLQRISELENLKKQSLIETEFKSFKENVEVIGVKISRCRDRKGILERLSKYLPWLSKK